MRKRPSKRRIKARLAEGKWVAKLWVVERCLDRMPLEFNYGGDMARIAPMPPPVATWAASSRFVVGPINMRIAREILGE